MVWIPAMGIGWSPVKSMLYDLDYWETYRARDLTDTGAKLTQARIQWVRRYYGGPVCDIGIGGGRFVDEMNCSGYDINRHATNWLDAKDKFCNPYDTKVEAATFWDSLEHIPDPSPLLENVRHWAFLSIPIFLDYTHVLRSKHYKPAEHRWYFTVDGLIYFMKTHGFVWIGQCKMEQDLGREDILTFAFMRG